MEKFRVNLKDGNIIEVNKGKSFYDFIKENKIDGEYPILMVKYNDKFFSLLETIEEDGVLETIDITNNIGVSVYARTLQFILIKAVLDLYPEANVTIEHSIHKGLVGEIHKEPSLGMDDISVIEEKMKEIIAADLPIKNIKVKKSEAMKIFSEYGWKDKLRLLKYMDIDYIDLYNLDGRYDYFYGPLAYSTGVIKLFKLNYYETGFLLRFPLETNPSSIKNFTDYKKLSKIFYETEEWGQILHVADVGSLNQTVDNGDIMNIIRVAEALHEKKIAYIADTIHDNPKIKLVLIAGPSSSGKTTFARRLGIQLRVNGLYPVPISLDDYFVDRAKTPKDENGDYDFESIYALDLELFNKNLKDLMEGKETEVPTFDFKKGEREWSGDKIKLPQNGILIVEGIHGLNEMLTSSIDRENKFKIYISALTQLNIDDHNRIATTDVRIIRRIVRDYLSRGYAAEDTLKMWPSIRRGEEKNIFVFQEEANVIFNSALLYELCILKKFALEELTKISEDSPYYFEAGRLKSFLKFFKDVDADFVPENSILREFIGGSCFYKY